MNGWNWFFEDMGFYGVDYRRWTMVAMMEIGANSSKDAVYAPALY